MPVVDPFFAVYCSLLQFLRTGSVGSCQLSVVRCRLSVASDHRPPATDHHRLHVPSIHLIDFMFPRVEIDEIYEREERRTAESCVRPARNAKRKRPENTHHSDRAAAFDGETDFGYRSAVGAIGAIGAIGARAPRAEIYCAYGVGAIGAIGARAPRAEIYCAYGSAP
jgi:hypothetical protein